MHWERKAAGLAGINVCLPAQDLAYISRIASGLIKVDFVYAWKVWIEKEMMAVVEFELYTPGPGLGDIR